MTSDASMRYRPKVNEVQGQRLVVSRLFTDESGDARERFVEMATEAIGGSYDEITDRFALNIVDIDARGFDRHGYFTLGKEVWVARDRWSSELIGFEVITRKRGGSIKLGPTLIVESFRGQRLAGELILTLLDQYAIAGARKVFVTAPLDHASTAALDFRTLGLQVEAILRHHYREGGTERVFGRLLQTSRSRGIPARVEMKRHGPNVTVIPGLGSLPPQVFRAYVIAAMEDGYQDIDNSFVDSILSGHERGLGAEYEEKGKVAFTLWEGTQFSGVAICTPKRGGAVKVGPVLINPDLVSHSTMQAVLRTVGQAMRAAGRRKLFFVVPTVDWNIICVLSDLGLIMEGILRAPYKDGCDAVVLSKFLD